MHAEHPPAPGADEPALDYSSPLQVPESAGNLPTMAELSALLAYNPDTGLLTWRVSPGRRCRAGSRAGTPNGNGYIRVKVRGRKHLAHRLAWVLTYGQWPENEIDHIDRNRENNRLANLREVTRCENRNNFDRMTTVGASGIPNVTWHAAVRRWIGAYSFAGRKYYLGCFDCPLEAARVVAAHRSLNGAALHLFDDPDYRCGLSSDILSPASTGATLETTND